MQIVLPGINGSGELWLEIMKIICGDVSDKSMVDLGCHRAPYTPLLGFKDRTYVDIQDRPLDYEWEQRWFIKMDALDFLKQHNREWDVFILSDVIEHLHEDTARKFLNLWEQKSSKQILFTPLGPYMISNDENPDSHRSGWTPEMLPEYLSIVLPNFHPTLGIGAFFSVNCSDVEKQRIINEINKKYDKN